MRFCPKNAPKMLKIRENAPNFSKMRQNFFNFLKMRQKLPNYFGNVSKSDLFEVLIGHFYIGPKSLYKRKSNSPLAIRSM